MPPLEDRVKIIPIEQPFLRVLADYVYDKFKTKMPDLSNILLIFPSQRNKFYFRRYLLEAACVKSIIPPAMKTIDELVEHCYESLGGKRGMLLSTVERNFILKDVIDRLKVEFWKDLSFLRFVSIGSRLLSFFDELAKERVTIDDIEHATELGHYPEKYAQNELPILKKIHQAYRKVLKESGYQDVADKNGLVVERFNVQCLTDYDYILLGGFAATTVVEIQLIKRILEELPSEIVLHSCKPVDLKSMDKADRPFYVHFKMLQALDVDFSKVTTLGEKKVIEPVVHVKEVKTESEQTFYLQSVLKKSIKKYKSLHRIGIVLPDESILYSLTESLRVAGIEYNRSAGLPLAQSSLYSFLGQLYEVVTSDYHYAEFFSFIRHPLFKNAVVKGHALRSLIYQLEDFMIKQRLNYFGREHFVDNRFAFLVDLLQDGFAMAQADSDLPEYVEAMINYLNGLLTYNKEFIKTNSPDISDFFEQLHNLTSLRINGKLHARGIGMLEFILRVLQDRRYRVEGDPMRGIQVIGLLEARNLDFDCLILPSMNEGIFPRRSEKDMFINQSVRRAVGLPYNQERENLYYYYYTELTKGKREVYISVVSEEERDVATRFISLGTPAAIKDESTIRLTRSAIILHKRAVKKSPSIVKSLYQRLQKDGLSPTALSDYRKCPYRYYLKYVLRITEPNVIVEEPGAKEWGEIVHAAVRNFYQYHFPKGFMQEELARATSVLENELEKALGKNRSMARKPRSVAYLDLNLYKRRLRRFLEHEVDRFKSGFTIFQPVLERKKKHHLSINGAQIRVYGYIDRVDLCDERYYIIDYKTGKIPARKDYEIGPDFNDFQLPLYALIFSREHFEVIGGMMYYEIGKKSKTYDVVEANDPVAYLTDFKQQILVPTIEEMLDPDTVFYQTENEEFCEYCMYAQLCGEEHGREA